jgi:elongation factor G
MDRDGANFDFAISTLRTKLDVNVVAIQIPVTRSDVFSGVIDIVAMRAMYWNSPTGISPGAPSSDSGGMWTEEITTTHDMYQEAIDARASMAETIADVDEDFLNLFLSTEVDLIKESDIVSALRRGCVSGLLVPAVCGASLKSKGVEPLLNSITQYLPSPLERPNCTVKNRRNGKTKDIVSTNDDLVAFPFKVMVDPNRGPLVFVRNFSGHIPSKSAMLWNVSKQMKERPYQLLKVSADDLVQTESIGRGDIGCIVGLKHTVTGDTLVLHKGALTDFELEGKISFYCR